MTKSNSKKHVGASHTGHQAQC